MDGDVPFDRVLAAEAGVSAACLIFERFLASVIFFDYYWGVKASELKRWLKTQGCTFQDGTRHTKVMLGNKVSQLPRHPAAEIRTGTYHAILKQLGLEKKE